MDGKHTDSDQLSSVTSQEKREYRLALMLSGT